jgi:hypothetical protein
VSERDDQYGPGLRDFAARWEGVSFEEVYAGAALDLIPATPGAVLDVGAGSGRDARWFAARGWDVVAVEPSAALRGAFGAGDHPPASAGSTTPCPASRTSIARASASTWSGSAPSGCTSPPAPPGPAPSASSPPCSGPAGA